MSDTDALPFSGLRVLDLTHVLAGPFASMMLGDLGAEVYKVEKPGRGDTTRGTPPIVNGASHYFLAVNRNKFSVGLDLKVDLARKIVQRLANSCDILIHNFRPTVLRQYGLDYEALRKDNPGLIYCSITGFGESGPYRDKAAFDVIVQSMAGIMSITGEPGGQPTRAGVSIGDVVAGTYAVQAIGAALYQRTRTGHGCSLDVSMFDCLFSLLTYYLTLFEATGEVAGPQGSGHPSMVPGGSYPTSDGYVTVAAFNRGFWESFCHVLEHPEWITDARFESAGARREHREALNALIAAAMRQQTTAVWNERLAAADVPAGPLWDIAQVMQSDQVSARKLLQRLGHPAVPDLRAAGYPVKMSGVDTGVRRPPPQLGADTEAVLRDVLALDDASIASLRAAGAIG